jgi:hypothetical protein
MMEKTFREERIEKTEIRLRKLEAVMVLLGLDDLNKAYDMGVLMKKLSEPAEVRLVTKCQGPRSVDGKCTSKDCIDCR